MKGLLGTILYLSMPYTTILEQLNPNIVTEEVKTKVIKTKYGKVQGFISRVGRDASTAKFFQVSLEYLMQVHQPATREIKDSEKEEKIKIVDFLQHLF